MMNVPKIIERPSPGNYYKPEQEVESGGLLGNDENSASTVLETALRNRRQKLSEKKIGLFPESADATEQ